MKTLLRVVCAQHLRIPDWYGLEGSLKIIWFHLLPWAGTGIAIGLHTLCSLLSQLQAQLFRAQHHPLHPQLSFPGIWVFTQLSSALPMVFALHSVSSVDRLPHNVCSCLHTDIDGQEQFRPRTAQRSSALHAQH